MNLAQSRYSFGILSVCLLLCGTPGCPESGVLPDGATDQTAGSIAITITTNLNTDPASTTVATINDADSQLALVVEGTQDAEGNAESITGISGTTRDGTAFSVSALEGLTGQITVGATDFQATQTGEDQFDVSVGLESASAKAWSAAKIEIDYNNLVLTNRARIRTLSDAFNAATDLRLRHLILMLEYFARLQAMAETVFDRVCIESDGASGSDCFRLLGLVDAIGRVLDATIAAHPELPAAIRALRFSESDPDGGTSDGTNTQTGINGCWKVTYYSSGGTQSNTINIWEIRNKQLAGAWGGQKDVVTFFESVRFDRPNNADLHLEDIHQSLTTNPS